MIKVNKDNVVHVLLLVFALYLWLPNILIIADGCDPSWVAYLAYTVDNHLLLGKDVIFEYGILDQLHNLSYTNNVILYMILSMCLNFAFIFLCFKCLGFKKTLLFFCFLLMMGPAFNLSYNYDSPIFFYIFLVCFYLLYHNVNLLDRLIIIVSIVIISHIKATFVALIIVPIIVLIYKKRYTDIILMILLYLMVWFLSQKTFMTLPSFFINAKLIASGFQLGMQNFTIVSYDYKNTTALFMLFLYLFSGVFIFFIFRKKIILLLTYAVSFFAYKQSIVRADAHLVFGACYFLELFLFLFLLQYKKFNLKIFILFIIACIIPLKILNQFDFRMMIPEIKKNYFTVKQLQEQSKAEINKQYKFPVLNGCSDLYPYDLSALISSGNVLCVRPIFQSYLATTKELLLLNSNHLNGSNAPDNIFWLIAPIDNRYPSEDDSLSWLKILAHYTPKQYLNNNYTLLHKNKKENDYEIKPLLIKPKFNFGDRLDISKLNNKLLWLKVNIKTSILEKITTFIYKPNQINMKVFYLDGSNQNFKLLPEIAKAGFILSPMISNNVDFTCLFKVNNNFGNCGKRIASIEFDTPDHRFTFMYNIEDLEISEITFNNILTTPNFINKDM